MSVPAFIDVVESEQVAELRSYLKEKGAEILEENSPDGLLRDITQVIEASSICWKDTGAEGELETVFNSIVSLILIVPLDQSEKLVVSFCEKLVKTQAADKKNAVRMRILSNLFHGLDEQSAHRYLVYMAMVKLAGQADLLHLINPSLSEIKSWVVMWDISNQKVQALLRALHEAFLECKQSEKATKMMIELLGTYTDDNASQARDDAYKCIVTCLGDPNTFIMDHLLALKPVKFLEGELIHDLLTIFISGRLSDYIKFYESHKDFVTSLGLSHEHNLQKMRLLTFMQMAEEKQEIYFDTIQDEMNLTSDDIEAYIIEVLRTKAVRAKIDHIAKKVVISSTTQRTFSRQQWQLIRDQLEAWQSNLSQVVSGLQSLSTQAH
ncbi:hypothetical protein NP493_402g01000 [Ridgeia piscesae]|uniref:Eukaryotic translation initiation factor 3 subunit M n=1 Tax=Ridgeia piscesae TaxID=27915 RepID=A0AAD9NUM4_RIDPI|nr:hypothetical protein NP493_402g01000 [Ridgeia piscesae]